ncbi:RICIN domain-containing protein [Micromonospora sp. DT233]|uniref:RICIN domain-containing protein n=1 Tax=Micromonospora sp. DT233 TaxID=3393432 RepID=UPI003CF83A1A
MAVENGDVVNSSTPARQVWWVQDNAPNGHFIFHATGCLDSNRWTEVYILPCNGGDYQRWHFDRQANGWYRIQNKATGNCLAMSVPDPKIAYTSDCRDTANQKFLIVN